VSTTFLYKYGAYTHDPGEITDFRWEIKPNMTRRGRRDTLLARATLTGRFLACTWEEHATKIANFLDAYGVNGKPFGLYHPDGSLSRSYLDPDDPTMLAGPYIADLVFPTGEGAEYVTKRDWKVVLEGIALSPESQIIQYEEQIEHRGRQAALWAWQMTLLGVRKYQLWPTATQTIVQRGSSIGLEGYYMPGWVAGLSTVGIPVLTELDEHAERRIETLGKPLKMGSGSHVKFVYYPCSWQYVFERQTSSLIMPY